VAAEIAKLAEALPAGALVVDGGNSNFNDTLAHAETLKAKNIELVDVGTSGGIWGRERGFSLMVGGEAAAVERIKPLLDALAKPHGSWHHFGKGGAGHFVKMVHNGVEYGLMQSFAEGYRLLKEGPYAGLDLAKVAEVWQKGSINQSFLNSLVQHVMKEDPELSGVEGAVAESGEARWTLETAQKLGIPTPVIAAALEVRVKSQAGDVNYATKLLAKLRQEFGGHAVNPEQ
jgi:6-phosphogluconate dehydrogenase